MNRVEALMLYKRRRERWSERKGIRRRASLSRPLPSSLHYTLYPLLLRERQTLKVSQSPETEEDGGTIFLSFSLYLSDSHRSC